MSSKLKLVAAVSGGVDSMVMLDKLAKNNDYDLVVAHVDHGIRTDSSEDARLVEAAAASYGLVFEKVELNLGPNTSEEQARTSRHQWLERVRNNYDATAIATAHHSDDLVETIIINIQRGTGWRGLSSLRETDRLQRPLISMRKVEIVKYAIDQGLVWREDHTNDQLKFQRNYIRHGIAAKLSSSQVNEIVKLSSEQAKLKGQIEAEANEFLDRGGLSRYLIIMADDASALELMRALVGSYPRPLMMKLIKFARTARSGKRFSLEHSKFVLAKTAQLVVSTTEDC